MINLDFNRKHIPVEKKITLTLQRALLDMGINGQMAAMSYDHMFDYFHITLQHNLYSFGKQTIKVPRDWKESVKERFAPRWYLKRHPIKYKTYMAKKYFTDLQVPDNMKTIDLFVQNQWY